MLVLEKTISLLFGQLILKGNLLIRARTNDARNYAQ